MKSTRKEINSLKYLMNAVISEKRMGVRLENNTIRFTTIDESAMKSILNSGIFSIEESSALSVLMSKTKTKTINESSIKKLDNIVEKISNAYNNNILLEGLFADVWKGLKGLGDKAKEALTGGWSKLKAIWGQFKELVTDCAGAIKEGLVKVFGVFKTNGIDAGKKLVAELIKKHGGIAGGIGAAATDTEKRNGLMQELKDLVTTNKFVTTTFFNNLVSKPTWEDDLIAGNASPSGDAGLDDSEAEDGLEDIEDMEESFRITANSVISERNNLLSNKLVAMELLKLSNTSSNINEAFDKLNAALKNPVLKSIVDWTSKILGYLLSPISALSKQIATMVGSKACEVYSNIVKALGGPGSFKFAIISTLVVDILGKLIASISPGGIKIATYFIPGFGQILASVNAVVSAIKTALMVYTFATLLTQFAADMQAGLSKKTEVTENSYKLKGKIKIRDGTLLYIK